MEDLIKIKKEILIGMPLYNKEFSSLIEAKQIGSNTFEYYDKVAQKSYTVKIFQQEINNDFAAIFEMLQKFYQIQKFYEKSTFVNKYYGFFFDFVPQQQLCKIFAVFEFLNGDLNQYILKSQFLDFEFLKNLCSQLICGCYELQARNFIAFDRLHPKKLLFYQSNQNNQMIIKVQLPISYNNYNIENYQNSLFKNNQQYISPNKINSMNFRKGLKKNDIFSVGILLIELGLNIKVNLYQYKSQHEDTLKNYLKQLKNKWIEENIAAREIEEFLLIIEGMVELNEEKRPNILQLYYRWNDYTNQHSYGLNELLQKKNRQIEQLKLIIRDVKKENLQSDEQIQQMVQQIQEKYQAIEEFEKENDIAPKSYPSLQKQRTINEESSENAKEKSVSTLTFSNGTNYEGEVVNGKREGYGVCKWTDGSRYEGYWRDDKATGKGKMFHADGDIYDGDWENDKANGQGEYKHMDGASYKGAWLNDKQHGYGVESWPDGAKYEGDYVHGKKQGFGKFIWQDGAIYSGGFHNNNIEGQGKYEWADGRVYNGAWVANKMEGKGIFTWADGRKYDGHYVDDKKNGYGIFEWPDGRQYQGQWKDGKQHGNGTYINSQGIARNGQWSEGKRLKWTD